MTTPNDLYERLDIPRYAPMDDIKRVLRAQRMAWAPDRQGPDADLDQQAERTIRLAQLNAVANTLLDDAAKAEYDELLRVGDRPGHAADNAHTAAEATSRQVAELARACADDLSHRRYASAAAAAEGFQRWSLDLRTLITKQSYGAVAMPFRLFLREVGSYLRLAPAGMRLVALLWFGASLFITDAMTPAHTWAQQWWPFGSVALLWIAGAAVQAALAGRLVHTPLALPILIIVGGAERAGDGIRDRIVDWARR